MGLTLLSVLNLLDDFAQLDFNLVQRLRWARYERCSLNSTAIVITTITVRSPLGGTVGRWAVAS